MVRNSCLFGIVIFLAITGIGVASAMDASYTFNDVDEMINRAERNTINLSVTAESENITYTYITYQTTASDPDLFIYDSNRTTASNNVFSNLTNGTVILTTNLTFSNSSSAGFIANGTTENFLLDVNAADNPSSPLSITINTIGISGESNSTTIVITKSFSFSGYVVNETGCSTCWQNATNVTLYKYDFTPGGPPTETPVGSALSNENGYFSLSNINASGSLAYNLRIIYYNESGSATKIGSLIPAFPAMMYYASPGGEGKQEFMKPPTLNGTTFYLEEATTINITANNNSDSQNFGYEIMEQKTGFPIVSNIMGSVSSAQVVVPLNRDLTIMVLRDPSQFAFGDSCDGNYMNNTACPSPPKSNSTISPTVQGKQIDVSFDLRISENYMFGCINASASSSIRNITSIIPRLLPWPGFIPPVKAESGNMDLTNGDQLNYSVGHTPLNCSGNIAYYNISLISADYLVEFYGKNESNESLAEWVGAFQNISIVADTHFNITLSALAGSYKEGGDVNTSKVTINFQNSSGGSITQDTPHVELSLRDDSSFGELHYIIETLTGGSFSMPIPSGATSKLKIFPNQAPPTEKSLNLSLAENNITLTTMSEGDMGFKKINSSGGMEQMNVTDIAVEMGFLKSSASCDAVAPGSACEITRMNSSNFNPLKALVAGKINMEMKLMSSNVTITFFNFDMFSAKQPPMDSVMNDQASSGSSTADQIWEFGSFVPADVYDYAIIGMPYTDTVINDSASISMSIGNLYDEDWNVVWNSSAGDTANNITKDVDEFLGNSNNRSYNSSGYRDFLAVSGAACSSSDSSLTGNSPTSYCYVNTSSNIIYMRVPHFSGLSPTIDGSAPATGGDDDDSGSGGGGGGGVVTSSNSTETNTTSSDSDDSVESSSGSSTTGTKTNEKSEDLDKSPGENKMSSGVGTILLWIGIIVIAMGIIIAAGYFGIRTGMKARKARKDVNPNVQMVKVRKR